MTVRINFYLYTQLQVSSFSLILFKKVRSFFTQIFKEFA